MCKYEYCLRYSKSNFKKNIHKGFPKKECVRYFTEDELNKILFYLPLESFDFQIVRDQKKFKEIITLRSFNEYKDNSLMKGGIQTWKRFFLYPVDVSDEYIITLDNGNFSFGKMKYDIINGQKNITSYVEPKFDSDKRYVIMVKDFKWYLESDSVESFNLYIYIPKKYKK